jgi:cytochrome c
MDSFELNKIMGAVLGTLVVVMGTSMVVEAIYKPSEEATETAGYALPEPEANAGGAAVADAAPAVSIGTLLASANVDKGAAAAKKCAACHSFGEGEAGKMGPNLYDIVERAEGSVAGYAYSDALKAHNAAGDVWSYENLDHFLTKPASYAPGTKMAFAGIASDTDRADLLAYLGSLSANPKPFPAAEAAPAEEGAPAEEAAPAAEAPAVEAPATEAAPEAETPAAETAPAVEAPAAAPAVSAPAISAPATSN